MATPTYELQEDGVQVKRSTPTTVEEILTIEDHEAMCANYEAGIVANLAQIDFFNAEIVKCQAEIVKLRDAGAKTAAEKDAEKVVEEPVEEEIIEE